MVAREGVTYYEVEAICERLMEAGTKPNQRNVRAELGTGSMSTILRHINTWMEKQSRDNDSNIELPGAVVAAMKKAMVDAVNLATSQLEAQLTSYKAQVEEDIKILAEHEDRIHELELEKELAAATKQVEDLQNQNSTLDEKLEASVKAQEIARTESAKAQLQVERADKATEKAEKRTEELTKEVGQLKDSLTTAEKEAATACAVSSEQAKAIERLETELAGCQVRYDELLTKHEQVTKSESAAKARLEILEAGQGKKK